MARSKKLSDDEVEALIGVLGDEDAENAPNPNYQAEIRKVELGVDDLSILGDYFALRMINERFCRLCKSIFASILRLQPKVSAFPPEIKTFGEYKSELDEFMSLTISKVDALKGIQLLALEPELVSALTSSYYGGSIIKTLRKIEGEFTATENLVIKTVSQGINDTLEKAWSELFPISFHFQAHEEQLQQTSFLDNEDVVVVCSFNLQLPDEISSRIDILYPLQMLKPIASKLKARPQSEQNERDLTWQQKLERAVLTIPLKLTAEIAKIKIDIGKLSDVKKDDTLPVLLGTGVKVCVEGKHTYTADLGNKADRTAIEIQKIHK